MLLSNVMHISLGNKIMSSIVYKGCLIATTNNIEFLVVLNDNCVKVCASETEARACVDMNRSV